MFRGDKEQEYMLTITCLTEIKLIDGMGFSGNKDYFKAS